MRKAGLPVPYGGRHRRGRYHSRAVALLLSLFLGWWGVDRFYLGPPVPSLLELVTTGEWGLWWAQTIARIAMGTVRDGRGHKQRW